MTDPRKLIVANALASQCVMAALAREVLLRLGSDAFIHAEQQARVLVDSADLSAGGVTLDAEMRAAAFQFVSDVFAMADDGGQSSS